MFHGSKETHFARRKGMNLCHFKSKFNIKPNSINPPVGMEVLPKKQENAGESFRKKMAKFNFDNKLINEHK